MAVDSASGGAQGMVARALTRLRRRPEAGPSSADRRPFEYEDAVALLVSRGVDEQTVRTGSIPQGAMGFVADVVREHCPRRPLRALHVGNFVGISLAALSEIVVRHDPDSVVVSVDPNLRHLGVHDPQRHVLAVLDHFGLQRSNLVICGYSLHRSANDTRVGAFPDLPAGENALANLVRLGQRFDVALIDGNHGYDYVRGELELLTHLLDDGAVLVLDDIANRYARVLELFEEVAADGSWPFVEVDRDARLGILRKTPGPRAGSRA